MSSRLKRKLGEIGVDTSSRKANENFCLIGTPLPPLEKSKDTGEFVPLWKQEVRDEKGRRRLHGAFTGGFSAGHFNTVGSKEGWTPQTFVSSRNDRAKKQAARPEDFMDDEDLQDLKDSRDIVDTTEQMDFLSGTQAEIRAKEVDDFEKDPITATLEASLLPAAKDSVGAKILKKMGWRLGQGIGPRISLQRRKEQDAQAYDATSGSKLATGKLDITEDDEEAGKHTYAPRDTPVLVVKRKDNTQGLGYTPGMSLTESVAQGPNLSGGFGLGALNDADEDDLDVYDNAPNHSRRRLAYDHIDGEDDDTLVIGGRSEKRKAPVTTMKSSTQHLRDGRPVLAGFVLSDDPVAQDRWFPLPEIPPGWKPDPNRVWAQDKENLQAPPPPPDVQPHGKWKRSQISADQRGSILGESPLPSAPRSVFDYMSEKDKERIKRITSGLAAGHDPSPTGSRNLPPQAPVSAAKLEPHVAQAALQGFQPFTNDPVKQARYTVYLQSQADPDSPNVKLLPGQKLDDLNKELEDFAKAASLFKPMSIAMAGRFTSAAVLDMGPKVIEGLHTPSAAEMEAKEAEQKKEEEAKISPKAHAAQMGMFGPLTRETKPWAPAKLLCKRFGVKEPAKAPEAPDDGPAAAPSAPSGSESFFPRPNAAGAASSSKTKDITVPNQTSDGPRDLNNIGFGEDETQGQDTLTYQRPSMDIFKAIFASDDEDSDDEENAPPDLDNNISAGLSITNEGKESKNGFTRATVILDETPVDPNTFKPTFIPREGKARKSKDDEKAKEKKEKKERKKKDKEKKGVLVSFEMDEDGARGDGAELKQPKDRPLKKKKRKEEKEDAGDGGMWTDKPPPEVPLVVDGGAVASNGAEARGRKRAIDFMD